MAPNKLLIGLLYTKGGKRKKVFRYLLSIDLSFLFFYFNIKFVLLFYFARHCARKTTHTHTPSEREIRSFLFILIYVFLPNFFSHGWKSNYTVAQTLADPIHVGVTIVTCEMKRERNKGVHAFTF